MKNLGLTFLFLFLLISLSAQETVDPNGHNVFYYPNGQKSSEGWLKDGQPEGWWKSYSEEGMLLSEGNRKNHLLDSLWTFYDKEGNKILEINYKEGKKNGPRIQYFKDEYTIENWTMDTLKGWVYTYSSEGWLKRATPIRERQTARLGEGVHPRWAHHLHQNLFQRRPHTPRVHQPQRQVGQAGTVEILLG